MEDSVITKRTLKLCVIGLSSVLLASCASKQIEPDVDSGNLAVPSSAELTGDFSRSKLIAADFVSTIAQLPEANPEVTVLHTEKPSSRFGELLLKSLQGAGFDLRIGDAESHNWLIYNANRDESLSDSGNPIFTFLVAAGEIRLKRSYEVDQYGVRPAGSMFVRGATTDDVVMDDSIFSVLAPEMASAEEIEPTNDFKAVNEELDNVEVEALPAPKPESFIKTQADEQAAEVVKKEEELANFESNIEQSEEVVSLTDVEDKSDPWSELSNMFETGVSRYEDIFKSYDVVEREVYVFANDSLVMGNINKQKVQQLVKNFNAETDIMSVIGCSHGATNLENGNAYLANNRALRVKEELVDAGLDSDLVLEEGCWANQHFPMMPARGVLVEHKRLSDSAFIN